MGDGVTVVQLDQDQDDPEVTVVRIDDVDGDAGAEPTVVLVEPDPAVGPVTVIQLDAPSEAGGPHLLDDLADVDAPPDALGVLTRENPGGEARFVPLAAPPVPRRHVQAMPAARWQIMHDLGYRPHFDVHLPDGELLLPLNVEHPVPGSITELVFGAPFTGTADPS